MQRDYRVASDDCSWKPLARSGESRKVFLPSRQGEPEAFLVQKSPSSRIRPHFHKVNQFQVVVAGTGTLGKALLKPVAVQYTDKNTPYGPIDAGPQGLMFFNFRQLSTEDTYFMPESREQLPRPPGRQIVAYDQDVPYQAIQFPGSEEIVEYKLLIGGEGDGPWVELYRYRPGQIMHLRDRSTERGQYRVVLKGEVEIDGEIFPEGSVRYLRGVDIPTPEVVRKRGTTILVLSFNREP